MPLYHVAKTVRNGMALAMGQFPLLLSSQETSVGSIVGPLVIYAKMHVGAVSRGRRAMSGRRIANISSRQSLLADGASSCINVANVLKVKHTA
jgi:hypothetical protein